MMKKKVQCWIFAKDQQSKAEPVCLLLKTNEARGSFWQPVTGSVDDGEDFPEAALREAIEETGLHFSQSVIDTGYEFEFNSRFGPAKERVYALVIDKKSTPQLDPHEHRSFQWLAPHQAQALLQFPSNKAGLSAALKAAFQFLLVWCFVFFLGSTFCAPSSQAAQDAIVTVEQSSIKAQPQADAAELEKRAAGSRLRVSSVVKEGWHKTKSLQGSYGWVRSEDITLLRTRSPSPDTDLGLPELVEHDRERNFRVRVGGSVVILFPSNLSEKLGRNDTTPFWGPGMFIEGAYHIENKLRLALRFLPYKVANEVQTRGRTYRVVFSGVPVLVGLDADIYRRSRLDLAAGLYAGVSIKNKFEVVSLSNDPPNSLELENTALGFLMNLTSKYRLSPRVSLVGEIGLYYSRIPQARIANSFNGDAIFRNHSGDLEPVTVNHLGPIVGAGLQISF